MPSPPAFWKQTASNVVAGLIVFVLIAVGGALYSHANDLSVDEWIVKALFPAAALGALVALAFWAKATGDLDMLLYERLKAVYAGLILTQRRLNREILGELIAAAESQHWKVDEGISDGDAFDGCATLVFTAPDGQGVTVRPDCESTAPADVAKRLHEASPANFPAQWRAPA